MKAYPKELRERVVAAWERGGETQPQIARRLEVSLRWVENVLARRRKTGSVEAKPHAGGRERVFDPAAEERLRRAVAERPDATLEELCTKTRVACALSTVGRTLGRLGLPRKKRAATPPSGPLPR